MTRNELDMHAENLGILGHWKMKTCELNAAIVEAVFSGDVHIGKIPQRVTPRGKDGRFI